MNQFIRQLTGVRFVAAAWVLLYHLQVPLDRIGVLVIPGLEDVLRVGRLGVDLFFALSGFILTHTYLTKLGPKLTGAGAVNFWWLRLARIYPVHFVMLNVAGLAVVAQAKVTGSELDRDWLNPWDYVKNLFLVQEWGPNPQRGWNFVAWSLSMEWLAYLLFPLLVLLLWRFHHRLATGWLVLAWAVAMAPLLAYATSTSDPYYTDNWGSTIRILTEFTAGAITYLIVMRFVPDGATDPRPRVERLSTTLSVLMPALVVIGAIVMARVPAWQPPLANPSPDAEALPPYHHLMLVPLLVIWIGVLALSRRGLARGLATRSLVLGGFISYSLYMTHLVWFGLWRAGMNAVGIDGGLLYAASVLLLIAGSLVIAWLMWRLVEEPAREWMRGLVGVRRKPTEEAGEAEVEAAEDAGDASPRQWAEPVAVPSDGAETGGAQTDGAQTDGARSGGARADGARPEGPGSDAGPADATAPIPRVRPGGDEPSASGPPRGPLARSGEDDPGPRPGTRNY
ncbi:MAG: acyltransferase family protein [Candidatus Nanopelagicales bacterium]